MLAQIAALPGVSLAVAEALEAMDSLLMDRRARTVADSLAEQSRLRGAWATSAMDGADLPLDSVLSGQIEDSPMGEIAARALALNAELPRLVDVFERAPLQAWARMSALVSAGIVDEALVGRPRPGSEAADPLRLGALPPAREAADRITALGTLLVGPTQAPALVTAAVAHGELAVVRPFAHGSGLVARGTIRAVLASRGVDPDLLSIPEGGLLGLGRPKYVRALQAYAQGTPEGMTQWLTWFCSAVRLGAVQAKQLAAELG